MSAVTYVDKMLTLGEMALLVTQAKCVIGNGCLEMRMCPHGRGEGEHRLRGVETFDFARIVPEERSFDVFDQAVHVQTGTWTCRSSGAVTTLSPLRQLPNCALQKVAVTTGSGTVLAHTVVPPAGAYVDRYEHILLNVNGSKAPCLVVDARTSYGRVAYVAIYMTRDVAFTGANKAPDNKGVVNTFTVGASKNVEVLHCVVHGDYTGTFLSPDTPQVSLQALDVARQAFALCTGIPMQLRMVNTQRWAALWRAQLEVIPNSLMDTEVPKLNAALQLCMFRLFASLPDSTYIGSDVVPGIRPELEFMTASLLPLRSVMMMDAFREFVVNPQAPTATLALYVVNAWAVFRATLDRVWLGGVMHVITKAVDEIVSRVQIAGMVDTGEVTGVGPTVGRRGQSLEDDAYTTVLVKHALEVSIQASYELRLFPRREWKSLDESLPMPVTGATLQATSATGIAPTDPEHVVAIHPYYLRQSLGPAVNVLTANKPLAETALSSPDPVLKAAGVASLAAYLPFVPDSVERADELDALLAHYHSLRDLPATSWNFLGEDQSLATISSFVACLLYGFARARVTGQVSIDGIHTEKSAVVLSRTASMPRTWKAVRIKSSSLLAPESLTVNIIV